MDFSYDPATAELAGEVRAFLADNLTDESRHRMHESATIHDGELHRKMAARGWLTVSTDDGLATRDSLTMAALFREMELADAPYHGLSTSSIVIGVVDKLASPELKKRVLPDLLSGATIAVLGYSEPDSGSDVAAARTRAVPADADGSSWIVNGQKMWTTLAQEAGHVLLLTRTSDEGAKHRGLTMFLVPLDTPGITIQPIYTIADERTNVVFYDDVHVPDDCRIGEIGGGWRVMVVALSMERGVMGGTAMVETLLHPVQEWALREDRPGHRPADEQELRDAIARARIDAEVAFLLTMRTAWIGARGQSPALAGNVSKLFATTAYQRAARELQHAAGSTGLLAYGAPGTAAAADGEIERAVRHSAVTTIQGGTSEIQRNHIAEYGLGLPKARGGTKAR